MNDSFGWLCGKVGNLTQPLIETTYAIITPSRTLIETTYAIIRSGQPLIETAYVIITPAQPLIETDRCDATLARCLTFLRK